MRPFTTPVHKFQFKKLDPAILRNLKVTYVQDKRIVLEKYLADMEVNGNVVSCKLTQEETGLFSDRSSVKIQLRPLTEGGDALISRVFTVGVQECLDDEVLK